MSAFVLLLVLFTMAYTGYAFALSRHSPRACSDDSPPNQFFVFVIPCLNEELVINDSLKRLFELPEENFAVLVIDDGSDDNTANIVRGFDCERVWLMSRSLPNARKGKGEALNAAFRYLRDSDVLGEHRPDDVVLGVFDADGRIALDALAYVGPYFTDPRTAAVQIGVRMYNADACLLARMQDVEFVTFTEIFQRARERFGGAGLGGNGQFVRLAALMSLGDAPWTACLTEDLDLGVRLLTNGWKNRYCAATHVSQQAVTNVRRLIRQRARWFQGHLQCWKLIPSVLKAPALTTHVANDVTYHLASPVFVLLMSVPAIVFVTSLLTFLVIHPTTAAETLFSGVGGRLLGVCYALTFGMCIFFAAAYRQADRRVSWFRALCYAHIYCLYGYMWFAAGWIAVARIVGRRQAWAKTLRSQDILRAQPGGSMPSRL